MTALPEVSIIIPAHNEVRRISQCLEAPLHCMAERGWEVIVVDDACTDGTGDVAGALGVKVIALSKNRGVAAARNAGAQAASGGILIFLDADIIVLKETLYTLFDYLQTHDQVCSVGACPGKNLNKVWSSWFLYLLCQWYIKCYVRADENVSCFPSECGAVRRTVFEEMGGFPETHGGVGMEEYSLGHSMERCGHHNVLLPDIQYCTYYNSVSQRCIELVARTARWVPLFLRRRRFEPVVGSKIPVSEIFSCYLVLMCLLFLFAGIFFHPLWWAEPMFLSVHFFVQIPCLYYILRHGDGGIYLAFWGWPITFITHLFTVLGFAWGVVRLLWRRDVRRREKAV